MNFFATVTERGYPNYEAIYNKSDEYKTLSRAKVATHLSKNQFPAHTLRMDCSAIVATVALGSIVVVAGIGAIIGAFMQVAYAPLSWSIITWIATGGVAVALLIIGACAGIAHYKHQRQPLSEKEFKRLMAEIENAKANDIERLKREIENYQKSSIQGCQKLVEGFEKLNFKPTG